MEKRKKRTQQQTLWKREKNTIYTQHLALNVSSLSLLMVGYIIGVCLPYTKQIHVFCFFACACVLVAAMFILLVCIFSFTHQRLNVKTQQQQQHFNMHSMFKGESLQRLWIAHKQRQQQVSPVTYRDLVLPTPMFIERSFQQFVFVLFLTCLACCLRYNTKIQIQTTFHVAVTQSPAARERIKIFGLDEHLKCHAKHGHKHQHTNSALSCLAKNACVDAHFAGKSNWSEREPSLTVYQFDFIWCLCQNTFGRKSFAKPPSHHSISKGDICCSINLHFTFSCAVHRFLELLFV